MDSRYRTNVPASHVPAQPAQPAVAERPATTSSPIKPSKKPKRKPILLAVAALAIVALVFFGGTWLMNRSGFFGYIDGGKYQAVFLTNGQVYFGKLHTGNDSTVRLTDIFYLQTTEAAAADGTNPQETSTDAKSDVQLIKLGSEIHGPTDEMIISRDQVLFYENIKTDGTVAKSIDKYHTDNK